MMMSTQFARARIGGAVLAGVAVAIGALGMPLCVDAQQARTPAPRTKECPDCDTTSDAQMERQLDAARAAVDRARQALIDALQQMAASQDTTGLDTEALARAQGQWRRAQERYERFTAELLQRRLQQARVSAEATMRVLPALDGSANFLPNGWLGVTFSASTRTVERSGGKMLMRFDDYPTIESVEPDSPAERAGLQAGDKLVALDGRDVTTGCEPFSTLLKPGAHLALRVKRGRYTKEVTAVIQKRPQSEWAWSWKVTPAPDAPAPPAAPVPSVASTTPAAPAPPPDIQVFVDPMPSMAAPMAAFAPRSGLMGGDVSVVAGAQVRPVGSLRDYFGVRDGVLVLHVVPGSVADRSGLRDGDVILSAGGHHVATPSALSRSIYRAGDAQELKLEIVRLKKSRTVMLKWDSR